MKSEATIFWLCRPKDLKYADDSRAIYRLTSDQWSICIHQQSSNICGVPIISLTERALTTTQCTAFSVAGSDGKMMRLEAGVALDWEIPALAMRSFSFQENGSWIPEEDRQLRVLAKRVWTGH